MMKDPQIRSKKTMTANNEPMLMEKDDLRTTSQRQEAENQEVEKKQADNENMQHGDAMASYRRRGDQSTRRDHCYDR